MATTLVIGGDGFFGHLVVDDLRRNADIEVVIASRHAAQFADLRNPASLKRALDGVRIAICAAGPYQDLPLSLAELCVERGIHYVDLADDRAFVRQVRSLVTGRESISSAVCTGWSTVSALSGLLVGIAAAGMSAIDCIRIQMAPGNRGARHEATIASLMHSVGRVFTIFRNGAWRPVRGWSDPREFHFPAPVGNRRGYLVDVPDHEVFPVLFNARTVEFRAGSELQFLNTSISMLGATKRDWTKWSATLQRAAATLSWLGHDWGAIGVEVSGSAKRRASIVADSGGERIAAMPAAVITRELLFGSPYRGLVSYENWLTEERLRHECEVRGFRLVVEEL